MLKTVLKPTNAQKLSKIELKNITGGGANDIFCITYCFADDGPPGTPSASCLNGEYCVPYDCGSRTDTGYRCEAR